MKVSQVLHKMGRDEAVEIFDSNLPIDVQTLFTGTVRGVHRDDPLLGKNVSMLMACGDTIIIDIGFEERKRK